MLLELVGIVLGGGEGETGRDDALDAILCQIWPCKAALHLRRVVCQIQEECDTLHTAVLLEISCEEATGFQIDTHGTKDDGEVVLVSVVYALSGLSY